MSLKRTLELPALGSNKVCRIITSDLPLRLRDDSTTSSCDSAESKSIPLSPQQYLLSAVKSECGIPNDDAIVPAMSMEELYTEPTDVQISTYGEMVNFARCNDLEALKRFHSEHKISLACSNQFNESLIHLACRRGYVDMVKFLIHEAGASLRVRDDYGRTPLHDACWTSQPNVELMELLISECPDLLLVSDKRGHCPFDYARAENHGIWVKFLRKRQHLWTVAYRKKSTLESAHLLVVG